MNKKDPLKTKQKTVAKTKDYKIDLVLHEIKGIAKKQGEHDTQFRRVFEKLTEHDKQFTMIGKRFTAIDKRFTAIDKRLDGHDKRFTAIDKRFTAIDQRFDGYDEEFEGIEKKLILLIEKSIDHDRKLENVVTQMDFTILEHRIIGLLDKEAGQLDRLDKEQASTRKALVRVEQDITKIKGHLKMAA